MSNCKKCGRDDGHWIGCASAHRVEREAPPAPGGDQCAFPGCSNDKRPQGKGPAPKYCTEHSDPKNRK